MTPREQASAQTARQPAWPGVIWMPWGDILLPDDLLAA